MRGMLEDDYMRKRAEMRENMKNTNLDIVIFYFLLLVKN